MPQFYAPQPSAPPPGNPYLSPLQALLGGATGGYQNAQAAQAQAQQQAQQAAAQASLRLQLGALANQGKTDVADTRAGTADRATQARQFTALYGINTKESGLSDRDYNQALTHMTDGVGSGALDPELAGTMMNHLRGGGQGVAPTGAGGGLPGGPPALASPLPSEPLTDSRGKALPGQKSAGDVPPGGRGFGLDGIRQPAPQGGQGAAPALPAGALSPSPPPAQDPPLPLPGGGGILEALRASNPANIAAPPPPGQAPGAPVPPLPGAPALMPGTPPALTPPLQVNPPALPPQAGGAPNLFAGQGIGPSASAKIAELATQTQLKSAQGRRLGNQDEINFQTAIGLLPRIQQPGFAAEWNARNGTNYALPGAAVPLPAGVQGPPGQAPAYAPNAMQSADIAGKAARAGLDTTLAGLDGKKFDLQKLTQQQQAQYQNRTLALKARGLSDSEARGQAQTEIQRGQLALGQGRLGLDRTKYLHPNAPDKDTGALQAKFEQRMTQLMSPGKPDYMGNAGEPLVKLDKAGNPSGPGANEYLQLMHLMRNATGGGAGPDRVPRGFAGALPKSQADFQKMPPAQQKAYVLHLRALNGH